MSIHNNCFCEETRKILIQVNQENRVFFLPVFSKMKTTYVVEKQASTKTFCLKKKKKKKKKGSYLELSLIRPLPVKVQY